MRRRIAAFLLMTLLLTPWATSSAEEMPVSDNEAAVFTFLTGELGLNTAAACGVLANLWAEARFEPDTLEWGYTWEQGGGYGICQWTNTPRTAEAGRRTDLVEWCGAQGLDHTSLAGQLRFLAHELATPYYDRLVLSHLREVPDTAAGAYAAGYRWCYFFEVPAGYDSGVSEARGALAQTYWARYAPLYAVLSRGDVNADGAVDSSDARLILQHEVGLIALTPGQLNAADVDADSVADSSDARLVLQVEVGLVRWETEAS